MSDFDPNFVPQKECALIAQKAVVLNSSGEVLLLKRSEKTSRAGGWDFPGGGLENGEDPVEGIRREILEETRLEVADVRPVFATSFNEDADFVVMIGYRTYTKSDDVVLNWEHNEYKWVTMEEALNSELPDLLKTIIKQIH